MSYATTFIPKPNAILAVITPNLPKPRIPIVFPSNCLPENFSLPQIPSKADLFAAIIFRYKFSISAKAISAVAENVSKSLISLVIVISFIFFFLISFISK